MLRRRDFTYCLRAAIGSIRTARRAGNTQAIMVVMQRARMATPKVTGSLLFTSYNRLSAKRAPAKAAKIPMAKPIPTNQTVERCLACEAVVNKGTS